LLGWFVRPRDAAPVRQDVTRSVGRVVLWTLVGLVFLRGFTEILHPNATELMVRGPGVFSPVGQEERAFAVSFARRYLTAPAQHEETRARSLARYLAEGLSGPGTLVSSGSTGAAVVQATVARESQVDEARVLLTVAAEMADRRTLYLTVPVARDARGGLVVYDLPALSPPPPRAAVAATATAPLAGQELEAISDLVRRFLRAYLGGESAAALNYFLRPGVRLASISPPLRLVAVDEIGEESRQGPSRVVIATTRVLEPASGALYPLRYRMRVIRLDRWYVASVDGGLRA
jgi:hypothetical protein